jgi:hypothetical protein
MMFITRNPDKYQTNASIHSIDKRQKESALLAFSKTSFNDKYSLLFLNKNI